MTTAVSLVPFSSSQGLRSALPREGLCFRSGEGAVAGGVGPRPMLRMVVWGPYQMAENKWIAGVITVITPITGVKAPISGVISPYF